MTTGRRRFERRLAARRGTPRDEEPPRRRRKPVPLGLTRPDVDMLCGLAAARLAAVTTLPGQPGLDTVSPVYFERLGHLAHRLIDARDTWDGP